MQINICVVAHNEQERIVESLVHIKNAIDRANASVNVSIIANGCSDFTVKQCQYFCDSFEEFNLYDLELGDKSNAWNYFVYQVQEEKVDNILTIFIDGDCFISQNSLEAMIKTYQSHLNVNAIAGYPATVGGDNIAIKRRMLKHGDFAGNFYALTPRFLNKIKSLNFRLPTGLIGDDSLLIWICGNDISIKNTRKPKNFITSIAALYYYERLVPSSYANIKKYLTRINRYSLRRMQQYCIRYYVDQHGFESLPYTIEEIYPYHGYLSFKSIRWCSLNVYFDLKNLLKIKKF